MSTATSGRRREHAVRHHLEATGWLVIRSAGSKGCADLIAAHPDHGAALLQIGTASKTLGPADRRRLLHAAHLFSALPLVVQVIEQPGRRTEWRWWLVDAGPAGGWTPWTPNGDTA